MSGWRGVDEAGGGVGEGRRESVTDGGALQPLNRFVAGAAVGDRSADYELDHTGDPLTTVNAADADVWRRDLELRRR